MSSPLKTRIMLADDHAVVRRGLRHVLDAEPDLEVVAEVGDGAAAVERALDGDIDLAVLDVTMPRMTGLQAAAELSRRQPQLRVLILSMHDNERYFFEALRAGASGYVLFGRGCSRRPALSARDGGREADRRGSHDARDRGPPRAE
jgi:DNA-binding NarL/FixJ family response regulator